MKKKLTRHQVGDTRIRTKFLLRPKIIDDELRWWERATWEEKLVKYHDGIHAGLEWEAAQWLPNKGGK